MRNFRLSETHTHYLIKCDYEYLASSHTCLTVVRSYLQNKPGGKQIGTPFDKYYQSGGKFIFIAICLVRCESSKGKKKIAYRCYLHVCYDVEDNTLRITLFAWIRKSNSKSQPQNYYFPSTNILRACRSCFTHTHTPGCLTISAVRLRYSKHSLISWCIQFERIC